MLVRPYQYWKSSQIEPKKIGWNAIMDDPDLKHETWSWKQKKKSNLSQREGFKCQYLCEYFMMRPKWSYKNWNVLLSRMRSGPRLSLLMTTITKTSCKIWRHRWLLRVKIQQNSPVHVCRICCLWVSVCGSWQLSASTAPQWRDCQGGCTSSWASRGPPSLPRSTGWKWKQRYSSLSDKVDTSGWTAISTLSMAVSVCLLNEGSIVAGSDKILRHSREGGEGEF